MRLVKLTNVLLIKKCLQNYSSSLQRLIYSETGRWDDKFTDQNRVKFEAFWKDKVIRTKEKLTQFNHSHPSSKFYCLSMFPYPSGNLHMGHVRVYVISDVIARFQRLQGKEVIHPMGWDAFGLPAENAAIEKNIEPSVWTKSNIQTMKKQLVELGCDFDWHRELSTCDPSYYRWTQHLFLMMYRAGLVYRKTAQVNWDPVDRTVLADEQISEDGRSWRSGALVQKVSLKQWYIRTTAFSKSLHEGLDEVDVKLWRDVVSLQRNWIGHCGGFRVELPLMFKDGTSDLQASKKDGDSYISIFTPSPLHHLCSISHLIIPPTHHLARHLKDQPSREEDQQPIRLRLEALNPFTNQPIPIFVSSKQHLFGEHLDHYIGAATHRETDKTFADTHNIPYKEVVKDGVMVHCGPLSGTSVADVDQKMLERAKELKIAVHVTSEKARDWLISRQRYWGTPIPVIHCSKCGVVPVPEKDLPVRLPPSFNPSSSPPPSSSSPPSSPPHHHIASPLANHKDWLHTTCPRCGGRGEGVVRETDTMDTFVDSSWYYLRYLDPDNKEGVFSAGAVEGWMPVHLYIGGKEHAILHLFYARFLCHFLHQQGLLPSREPFKNLLTQGMVLGRSLKTAQDKYLKSSDVVVADDGKTLLERGSGEVVVEEWEKMSKSKHNGVDPKQVLTTHGTDTTRLCILSNVSPHSDRLWSEEAFVGVERWQKRLWSLLTTFLKTRKQQHHHNHNHQNNHKSNNNNNSNELEEIDGEIDLMRNHYLLQINFHLEKTFLINTALSRTQSLTTFLHKQPEHVIRGSQSYERALLDLIIILSPFAPSFCSELWSPMLDISLLNSHYERCQVSGQRWPVVDDDFHLPMHVKINNKEVCSIRLPMRHDVTDKLLTSQAAWELVEEDVVFKGVMEGLVGGGEGGWKRVVKSRSLTNQGNSKVDFEVVIDERYNRDLLRLSKGLRDARRKEAGRLKLKGSVS